MNVAQAWIMAHPIPGHESGIVTLKEGDEVRVNDEAILAPDAIRGEIGIITRIDRFPSMVTRVSE